MSIHNLTVHVSEPGVHLPKVESFFLASFNFCSLIFLYLEVSLIPGYTEVKHYMMTSLIAILLRVAFVID